MNKNRFQIARSLLAGENGGKHMGIMLLLVLHTCMMTAYPFLYKYFIDEVLFQRNLHKLMDVILSMLLWMAGAMLVTRWRKGAEKNFILSISMKVKERIFRRFLGGGLEKEQTRDAGEMKQVLEEDVKEIETFFAKDIFEFLLSVLTVILLTMVMALLQPVLTLCCFGFFLLSYVETKYLNRKMTENAVRLRRERVAEEQRRLEDLAHGVDVKCLNMERTLLHDFEERTAGLRSCVRREKMLQYVNKYFGALNHDLITRFFIYIVGGMFVIGQNFPVSSFLVFSGFYETFVKNVRAIMESSFAFSGRKIKLEKILAEMNAGESSGGNEAQKKMPLPEKIELEAVTFCYPESPHPVLRERNIALETGHVYEIQGKSGAGKSTLCSLLLRENAPTGGQIKRNGTPVSDIPIQSYLSRIRLVSADTKIFQGTIRSNLLLAKENATEEELWKACERAKLAEDVRRMPGQLDYHTGENGQRLSGGQKERLAMARLFLTSPHFILLDEALAEVSASDEMEIYRRVIGQYPQAAILIISHRVHTYGEKIRC